MEHSAQLFAFIYSLVSHYFKGHNEHFGLITEIKDEAYIS